VVHYVYLKKHSAALDWDYITAESEKLGIAGFEKRNRALALRVFHAGGMQKLSEKETELLDYFIESEAYGSTPHAIRNYSRHIGMARYVMQRVFFPMEEVIEKFSKFGSQFIGHPNNKLPGIEMNSGSLGHGLPVAVGMALAGRMSKRPYRVYTVMGDGELAEGSVWEGFMSGGHYGLDNLCAIIDLNGLQISGTTDVVMNHREIAKQVADFGWHVIEVDGHDFDALHAAFEEAKQTKGVPTAVIAHTIKGYGAKIMENKAGWHHHLPDAQEYEEIMKELEERRIKAEEEQA